MQNQDKLGAVRLTKQRQIILEELKKVKTHPTADEVYIMVRDKLPKISIATVYRNLEALSNTGYVLKIESAGSQKRFDGNTHPHFHIRCINCGKVRDIEKNFKIPDDYKNIKTDFKILGYDFSLYGICKECDK
jgi:Fur family transcriptional regulator, ferric uptake regulator